MTSTASKEPAEEKYRNLLTDLSGYGGVAVAFSGGVDSTFLLVSARQALGDRVLAVTLDTPYIPRREVLEARRFAREHGIAHLTVRFTLPADIVDNPPDRCYLCKLRLFTEIRRVASGVGFTVVADGSNADDLGVRRPGLRALRELGVLSPLAECGLLKAEIRALSRHLNLATWNKPAYACLLTRFPHHTLVTPEVLQRVEGAEDCLADFGFSGVRVRTHGNLARIEVPRDQRARMFDEALMDAVTAKLKAFGYGFVTFDLAGYRTGSLDIQQSNSDEVTT